MSLERALTKCAVYLVLEQEGRVLLQLRKNSGFYDGYYGLPSGHWEYGEYLTDTMIREAKEEANIDLDKEDLKLSLVWHSAKNKYIIFFMRSEQYSGNVRINEPDKCDDLRFFEYSDLPDNIMPCIKHALLAIEQGIKLIEGEV